MDIEGKAVYTNNPPAGAFRGFGVTQTAFALESCMNLLAEQVGISEWEIRYRNAVAPGDLLPNGQTAGEATALKETYGRQNARIAPIPAGTAKMVFSDTVFLLFPTE